MLSSCWSALASLFWFRELVDKRLSLFSMICCCCCWGGGRMGWVALTGIVDRACWSKRDLSFSSSWNVASLLDLSLISVISITSVCGVAKAWGVTNFYYGEREFLTPYIIYFCPCVCNFILGRRTFCKGSRCSLFGFKLPMMRNGCSSNISCSIILVSFSTPQI